MDFLDKKREEIDAIDDKLVELLERRFRVVREVIRFKKQQGVEIEDREREETIKARYLTADLPEGYSDKFFNNLFDEAKKEEFVGR